EAWQRAAGQEETALREGDGEFLWRLSQKHPATRSKGVPPSSAPPGATTKPSGSECETTSAGSPSPPNHETPALPGDEIPEELGRSRMAVVFTARHQCLPRLVALKVLLREHVGDLERLERFHAEAATLARLHHPNIVRIFEVGEHQGQPFFAMEFLAGGSLRQ